MRELADVVRDEDLTVTPMPLASVKALLGLIFAGEPDDRDDRT